MTKLPRKAHHCGAVGIGAESLTSALVGDWISMSVILCQMPVVGSLASAFWRSRKLKRKSAVVSLSPLWKMTSSRNVTAIVVPAASVCHAVITLGTSFSAGVKVRGESYTLLKIGIASGVVYATGSQPGTSVG